jgi:hypothetical protein
LSYHSYYLNNRPYYQAQLHHNPFAPPNQAARSSQALNQHHLYKAKVQLPIRLILLPFELSGKLSLSISPIFKATTTKITNYFFYQLLELLRFFSFEVSNKSMS